MLQLIFIIIASVSVHATTFKIQPIEQQIREADGLFQGNFLKKEAIELEDGTLATQMFFKMNKEVGLHSDFFGMDEVIVHYPGGKLDHKEVRIEGVPEFVPGEKVVLFIKSVNNRYWGMNLGFGSFRVINFGNEKVLVNYAFPHHPVVGQMSYSRFEKTVKSIKGSKLKVVRTLNYPTNSEHVVQRIPASYIEGQNRTVASKSDQLDNQEDRPGFNVFWLIMVLGFVGGVFRLYHRRV